jgi:hypothetical protein
VASDNAVPTLTVTGGPHDGQTLSLLPGGEYVLGSGEEVSLRLGLPNVAARHARLRSEASRGVSISDLGSSAGTFVNGEKLQGERLLNLGDRVCLGPPGVKASVKLLVVSAPPAAEPPAIILDTADSGPAIILDDEESPAPAPPPAPTPPPVQAPTPPPAAVQPPAAVRPSSPPPRAEEPRRPKPEYTDEPPSIVPTIQRQPLPVPPPPPVDLKARLEARKKSRAVDVPKGVLVALAAVVVLAGGYLAARPFLKGPPTLRSVLPPRVEIGQTVTLAGDNFGSDAAAVTVRVGDLPGTIVSASDTAIAVAVPELAPDGGGAEFPVSVETRKGRSNALTVTVTAPPRLTALTPDVAMPGDEVVASGKHLKGNPALSVDGQDAEVLEAAGDRLRFRVPAIPMLPGRAASVVVRLGREQSKPMNLFMGRLPLLIEAAPSRAQAGERVTLKGRGFAPQAESNQVRFAGQPALVLSASERELVVAAPGVGVIAAQFDAPVQVEVSGARSNPVSFVLQRPSTGVFLPRYFAVPGERPGTAFVSTELGPVLLLGARGEMPSLAERAARVATALNGLIEEALNKPLSLEVREGSLAVVGGAALVRAEPEDAAAYEELDPGSRTRRATAQAVAALWAGIVQEQLDLFVHRQRPGRLLEITPRGRAMMQIYAEAVRRAGPGAGVPLSVVSPLPSGLGRELREMALSLPAEGAGSAAAAVEGRWHGTMWEEGSGERPIVVRLRVEGKQLGGSLTTRAGGISGELPIQDASYDKGLLRFAVTVGGARQLFEGRVEGERIAGSITRAGAAGAVGRFTLSFGE